ncbi:MAG: hypothetical protein JNL97_17095 [Verrucomicrobiales bacterium]|nr:hypothetical protein [Verrucomicrobiales bacterium]
MRSLEGRRVLGTLLVLLALSVLIGTVLFRSRPALAPNVPVVSEPAVGVGDVVPIVALGSRSGALLTPDGRLRMWGQYRWSAVVAGRTSLDLIEIAPDSRWRKVAAGNHHYLMIREDGTLWGIGANFYGQLGFPLGADSNLVQLSPNSGWIDVAAGSGHSLALRDDGSLWAWGADEQGQTGSGQPEPAGVVTPREVSSSNRWQAIAAGRQTSAAIHKDGTLWAWGNLDGVRRPVPERVDDRGPWSALAGGEGSTLVALRDGTPHTNVTSLSPAFQNGRSNSLFRPIESMSGERWRPPLLASESGYVARGEDGSWWAIGENHFGRFGTGDSANHATPVRLPWPRETLALGMEGRSIYAFLPDGTLWRSGVELGTLEPTPHNVRFARKMLIYGQALFDLIRRKEIRSPTPPYTAVPVKVWTWPDPKSNTPHPPPEPK